MKHFYFSLFLVLINCAYIKAQQSVLFEAGTTYFTNEYRSPYVGMADFLGFTFNTRLLFKESDKSALSLEFPFSIRSKSERDDLRHYNITTRFGLHIPVLFTYNYGAGASGMPSGKKWGVTACAGWGYFVQKANSLTWENPSYKESVSFSGPSAVLGARYVLTKTTLFRINNKNVNPANQHLLFANFSKLNNSKKMFKTSERVDSCVPENNYVYQRSLCAYIESEKIIKGDVLELGCGHGYHIDNLSRYCNKYIAIDKYRSKNFSSFSKKVEFIKMRIPPLSYIPFNSYDVVLCFQVLEHIKDDLNFLKEMNRVLKPGGVLLLTTPNACMTITRNPWHVREYSYCQLEKLMNTVFDHVSIHGIVGNEKVMDYYAKNRSAVHKIARWDFLKLHEKLPGVVYRPFFDLLNHLNRKKLLGTDCVANPILHTDFKKDCSSNPSVLDLFCVARKKRDDFSIDNPKIF